MEESSQFHTVRGYQRLEQNDNQLTSAMEDYLEMIYRNSQNENYIRINTISELLNVSAPSATKMVQNLNKQGLVVYKKYEFIVLTEKGKEIGKYLLERHKIIETFLRNLGVDKELLTDTELVEHDLSRNTVNCILQLNNFFETYPEVKRKFYIFKKIN